MANVSQKVSSYVHGISQQPDHLKRAGQVRHLLNGLPDVTEGLKKRSGSELLSTINTNSDGKWFTIFRDANEKYIAQIADGGIRIWSLIDGQSRHVNYSSVPIPPTSVDGDEVDPLPPGSNDPNKPATCDPVALAKATQAVIDATSEQRAAKEAYDLAINHYNDIFANRKVKAITEANQTTRTGYWTDKNDLNNDEARLLKLNKNDPGITVYIIAKWRYKDTTYVGGKYGYDYYVYKGTHEQLVVDKAAGDRDVAYGRLQLADGQLYLAKQDERIEQDKCKSSNLPKALVSYTLNTQVPYLRGATAADIETLTLNDYTFIVNKKISVSMGKDESTARPFEAFVELKNLEYNSEYSLKLVKPGAVQNVLKTYAKTLTISPADWTDEDANSIYTDVQTFDRNDGDKINLRYTIETRPHVIPDGTKDYDVKYQSYVTLVNGGEGWVVGDTWEEVMKGRTYTITVSKIGTRYDYTTELNLTPYLTPKNETTGILKPLDVLSHFQTQITTLGQGGNWTAQIIGNGLYITGPSEFSAYASGGKSDFALEVMTNKVNNISKLPIQCKDGYIVKILNTGELEDDYYVKFVGTKEGVDGTGAWEETVAPGININLNETTMPHQLVRMADGTFTVSPVDWEDRLVGDRTTNPVPSFVGKTINKMLFYRNRLGFLSDENIIFSRAGDYFNFFAKTALTVSDSDPIDLATSSTTPSVLHDAVPLNTGLVLFSRERQFILSTANDVLTPVAVKLEVLSTYNCSEKLPAFEMGTTVGFLAKAGIYSAMWEMTNINSNTIPEVIEQSKIVQELLPASITDIANNKDNSLIVFGTRNSPDLYLYRYFNDGEKRIQSAWFQWSCAGNLIHHAVDEDVYYQVVDIGGSMHLTRTAIRPNSSQQRVVGDAYSPRLDLKSTLYSQQVTYDQGTNKSKFIIQYPYTTDAVVYNSGYDFDQGVVAKVEKVTQVSTGWEITVPGNWSAVKDRGSGSWIYPIHIGYPYSFTVELPYTYFSQTNGERTVTDTRAYTNVHRMKFELSKVGYFDIIVSKKGKDTYVAHYEQSPADDYRADTYEIDDSVIHTVPIYEKNTNALVTVTSNHPTPCTLLSSMWEGAVSTKSYKSV